VKELYNLALEMKIRRQAKKSVSPSVHVPVALMETTAPVTATDPQVGQRERGFTEWLSALKVEPVNAQLRQTPSVARPEQMPASAGSAGRSGFTSWISAINTTPSEASASPTAEEARMCPPDQQKDPDAPPVGTGSGLTAWLAEIDPSPGSGRALVSQPPPRTPADPSPAQKEIRGFTDWERTLGSRPETTDDSAPTIVFGTDSGADNSNAPTLVFGSTADSKAPKESVPEAGADRSFFSRFFYKGRR